MTELTIVIAYFLVAAICFDAAVMSSRLGEGRISRKSYWLRVVLSVSTLYVLFEVVQNV